MILHSNIWLHPLVDNINSFKDSNKDIPVLFYNLLDLVKEQLEKQKSTLHEEMEKLINNEKETWLKICKLTYKNNKYNDGSKYRQDLIPYGLKCSYSIDDLNRMTYAGKHSKFDSLSLYDFNNYLSTLIINANLLNGEFIKSIELILNEFIVTKKCAFFAGKVFIFLILNVKRLFLRFAIVLHLKMNRFL